MDEPPVEAPPVDEPPVDDPVVELLSPVEGDALPPRQSVDVPAVLLVLPEPLLIDPEELELPYVPDVVAEPDVPAVLSEPWGHGFAELAPEPTPLDVPLPVESVDELPEPTDDPLVAPGMLEPEVESELLVCARTGPATRVAANAIASAFVIFVPPLEIVS